jgi:hypothetical protein
MVLNVFLFFPETANQILDETSKDILSNFNKLLNRLKIETRVKLFYDSNNINSFIGLNDVIQIYLDKDIQLLRIKLSKNNAVNTLETNIIENDCSYFKWNLDTFNVENIFNILREITERKIQFNEEKYILINFNNSIEHCRERILVFKDAKHLIEFPVNFIHIDFVSDFLEFEIWLKTNHIKEFSVLNKNKFKRTSFVQQGKPVFESIENGFFWYIDNFHKDEYEVFDSNRNHIGVADLMGELNTSKAIKGRIF